MHNVIELIEQKGYRVPERFPEKLTGCSNMNNVIYVSRQEEHFPCLSYSLKEGNLTYQTSYYIGLDWLEVGKLAAYVRPKMDDGLHHIDYIRMLSDVLGNTKTHKYLSDLIYIQFDKPYIEIETKDDELSPFIILQYMTLLRKLVQKGLKKSYYTVEENLNSRIKGRILVGRDVKSNQLKGNVTNTFCRYSYFGPDSEENRILKTAFVYACTAIKHSQLYQDVLSDAINYIRPAFENISTKIDVNHIKHFNSNPIYPEYNECLRLAILLIKRYSYSITSAYKLEGKVIPTPPYWIDMSKLFELYIYQKLLTEFPTAEIEYHKKLNYQEPDILFKHSGDNRFVIDAKYKNKYEDSNISKDDVRQVCGYTRMRKVYDFLEINTDQIIPALIIYPVIGGEELTSRTFNRARFKPDDRYIELYKYGIKLPLV
jgi:5-methylcytosine-specific restriction enzyme subunit McrC